MQMGKASPPRSQSGAPGWCWQKTWPPSPRRLRSSLSTGVLGPLLSPTKCGKGHGCPSCQISTRQGIEGILCSNELSITQPARLEGLVNIDLVIAEGTHELEF